MKGRKALFQGSILCGVVSAAVGNKQVATHWNMRKSGFVVLAGARRRQMDGFAKIVLGKERTDNMKSVGAITCIPLFHIRQYPYDVISNQIYRDLAFKIGAEILSANGVTSENIARRLPDVSHRFYGRSEERVDFRVSLETSNVQFKILTEYGEVIKGRDER